MRIGIVQFPGSNCERETMLAVKRAGMEPVEFLWNEPREKLRELDGYIIVGGFSYEDRSRAGVIAALDPVMQEIRAQSETGKPVLGICNGAQILVETGMVPGLENNKLAMVLTENRRMAHDKILGTGFYNAWVHLKLSLQHQRNAFTRHLTQNDVMHVPVAHAEGRFVMSDALLHEVQTQGLNAFQYCDATGNVDPHFPVNPNGSVDNIAAISNKAGNVMAIMPHPERTINGDAIFRSMRDYIAEGQSDKTPPLYYYPRRHASKKYVKPAGVHECIVELVITDNHAMTVQNTLRQQGIPVTVRRQVHWEIHGVDEAMLQEIRKSGVLYNERKEKESKPVNAVMPASSVMPAQAGIHSIACLVRAKDDVTGQQRHQTLREHFNLKNIDAIFHGTLWHFSSDKLDAAALRDAISQTNIISNPYAHDCYDYI